MIVAEIAKENTHNSDVQQKDANKLQTGVLFRTKDENNVELCMHHQTVERHMNIARFAEQLKGFLFENEWV